MKKMGANDSATIKCTFKNKKTTKKATKSVKVNVVANKVEEEVVEAFAIDVTATSKKTFEVKFNKVVTDAATITLEKVVDEVASVVEPESVKFAEDKLSAVITLKANIQKGTYRVTLVDGDIKAVKEIATTEDAATQIKITSTTALTNPDRDEAYIYYDVIDQYGDSIRNSSSITWTTSAPAHQDDLNEGMITIYANAVGAGTTNTFMYNSDVVVVGVDTTAQLTVQETIKIGMPQKLDTVEFKGFVDLKGDKTKLLNTLPANFAKERYVLAYQAKDQDGHIITGNKVNQETDVIFTSSNPMLIDAGKLKYLDKTKTPELKIGKEKFFTIAIEPGEYAAQGGEIDITAVSTNTGSKKNVTYVIGGVPVLKSFKIGQPDTLRAGDQNIEIPFTATDVNGTALTTYESIVRSSNELSFTCSRGTLKLAEQDDGTAKLTWSDKYNVESIDWTKDDVMKNDGQMVSMSSMVIGGELDTRNFNIKAARMPSEISKVTVASTYVKGDEEVNISLDANDDSKNMIWFVDQDGKDISKKAANNFFAKNSTGTKEFMDKHYYDVMVTPDDKTVITGFGAYGSAISNTNKITLAAAKAGEVEFTYQICKVDESGVVKNVGDEVTAKYKVITLKDAKTKVIQFCNWIQKQNITLGDVDKYDNFKDAVIDGKVTGMTADDAAKIKYSTVISDSQKNFNQPAAATGENWWKTGYCWYGITAGADINVPKNLFELAADSEVVCHNGTDAIWGVTGSALKWGDFYNSETGKRQVAKKTFKLVSKEAVSETDATPLVTISTKIEISNEARKLATIEYATDWSKIFVDGTKLNVVPENGVITFDLSAPWGYEDADKDAWTKPYIVYKDQYGQPMAKNAQDAKTTFTVTDLKESETELTHVPGNLEVESNGTASVTVKGAEIGDTFKLTVANGDVKTEYTVTVKADGKANLTVANGASMTNNDKDLRTTLKYKK